jgi:hypothetical protein
MPRNAASAIQNNFIGGFVTQATALNFPPNAAFDQDNVVFSETSVVSRRNGFDYENNFTLNTQSRGEQAQTTYHWKNASGDGLISLVVHQNGDTLSFYDTTSENSLSGGLSANSVSLTSFLSSGATTENLEQNECQYSSGLGYLFVVHPYCDPFYVKFNADGTFTSSIITFTVRDLAGIPDGALVDTRPSGSLSDVHKYNLYNQGWDSTKYGTFNTAAGKYPSNADVWWIFKDSSDTFNPSTTLANNSRGSTHAPQGYFRLNPWNTARAATALAQAGITVTLSNADETSGTLRPSVTEFHAGRVFYAGVNTTGYNSRIYFSRIVQGTADFGYCGATNDPTNETLFDFLPSDGGVISIPQAGRIYRLVSLGPTLLVFGANGVWALSGSTGVGFTATDYQITPIGYIRSVSGTSFVIVDNTVMWWNNTGIWAIGQTSEGISVKSISDDKIKDFFIDDISNEAKAFARGIYNPRTHTVHWLYRTAEFASIEQTYTFDSVLSFNTLISAFYTWSVDVSTISLNSIVVVDGAGSVTGSDIIVDNNGATVVDNLGNDVITYGFSRTQTTTSTKYLVHNGTAFTFAECFNVDYLDWVQAGLNTDYTSFFTTGYNVKTQGERRFQTNYIFIFSDLSGGTNNEYSFQALWNYGTSGNTGEWTQRQTVTQAIVHAETNYDASRRRLKVRGSGTAVQFKFSSVTGKPFNIVGWSTYDTANQQV